MLNLDRQSFENVLIIEIIISSLSIVGTILLKSSPSIIFSLPLTRSIATIFLYMGS